LPGERINMPAHVRNVAKALSESAKEARNKEGVATRSVAPRLLPGSRLQTRRRVVTVNSGMMEEIFRHINHPDPNVVLPQILSIPLDSQLVGGSYDAETDAFKFVFEIPNEECETGVEESSGEWPSAKFS